MLFFLFLYSSGRGRYRRDEYLSDAGPGDRSWGRQRYSRGFDGRTTTRGKSHFTESSFSERRRSFPKDPDERRMGSRGRDRGTPHRSLFHELSTDRDERGTGRRGKERGQRSFRQNKQVDDGFMDDYMEELDFSDDK